MAASSLGSRKGLSSDFPRLTGRAIDLIAQLRVFLIEMDKHDLAVFLQEIMLCQIWRDNYESNLPADDYDMNYMHAKDDPKGCVRQQLEAKGIGTPVDQLIDRAIEEGYISFDPSPLDTYPGDGWGRFDNYRLVDLSHIFDKPRGINYPGELINIVELEKISRQFPWVGLILGLVLQMESRYDDIAASDSFEAASFRVEDDPERSQLEDIIQWGVDHKAIVPLESS